METAAGVCFIIAAILNGFAAMTYNAKGKLNTEAAKLGTKVDNALGHGESDNFSDYRNTGLLNSMFSIFLYLSIPLLAFSAISLFNGSNAEVIAIASIFALLAEIIGGMMSKYGPSNIPGFIGGAIALYVSIPVFQGFL